MSSPISSFAHQHTALVLIDLQQGIVNYAKGPHSSEVVVTHAARLAQAFRAQKILVVGVRVGWSNDFADNLKQPVDANLASQRALPENWWHYASTLNMQESDIHIIKRQWGAFYGTELDLQLRRRGIHTIVLGGISTNIGVESTARNAWELGYKIWFVEDMMSAASAEEHHHSFKYIFPRIGRITDARSVLDRLVEPKPA